MLMLIATLMMMMIARWCAVLCTYRLCWECQHLIIASRTVGRRSRLPGCDYFCSGPTRGTRRQSWPPSSSAPANEEANKILMKSWFFVLLMRSSIRVFRRVFVITFSLPSSFWASWAGNDVGESRRARLLDSFLLMLYTDCAGSCLPSDRQAREMLMVSYTARATLSKNIRISRFLV